MNMEDRREKTKLIIMGSPAHNSYMVVHNLTHPRSLGNKKIKNKN